MNGILIIAHAPLAHALRQCALHVLTDCGPGLQSLDVRPNVSLEESVASARICMELLATPNVLLLTDLIGATPYNVALRLVNGQRCRLVTGVNLSMLVRALTYRQEPLETMVARAVEGGTGGIMQIATTAPQNQPRKNNDQSDDDHQQ